MLIKLALAPLLLWQGARVRRQALRLPEAAGPRAGRVNCLGDLPGLNLLVVGDSSAAGVGVATQDHALAAPLAAALSSRLQAPVGWQLVATSGHGAADALQALRDAPDLQPADLMLVVLGVNDAVAMTRTRTWLATLDALHAVATERAGVRMAWHTAPPPMGRFPLLPQPLRWVLGREAARLDQALKHHLQDAAERRRVALPAAPAGALPEGWMAPDGYHPGPLGYAAWVESLADHISQAWSRQAGTAQSPCAPLPARVCDCLRFSPSESSAAAPAGRSPHRSASPR